MTGTNLWIALAGVELCILLLVLSAAAWWRYYAARARDRKAVEILAAKVKAGRTEREAALRTFLADRLALGDDVLEAAAVPIAKAELGLYREFVNLYAKRDATAAARFDLAVEAAVEPYWRLQAAVPEAPPAEVAADPQFDTAEIERLQTENQRLSDELQITMGTMSRMLSEYSAMFAAATAPGGADPMAEGAAREAAAAEASEHAGDPGPVDVADAATLADADEVDPDAPEPDAGEFDPPVADADALVIARTLDAGEEEQLAEHPGEDPDLLLDDLFDDVEHHRPEPGVAAAAEDEAAAEPDERRPGGDAITG